MKLKITCPYCKTLDLRELFSHEPNVSESTRKKMIRYYCNSSESSVDYCSYCGMKEECPYSRD